MSEEEGEIKKRKGKRIKNGRIEGVMQFGREQRKYDEIEKEGGRKKKGWKSHGRILERKKWSDENRRKNCERRVRVIKIC